MNRIILRAPEPKDAEFLIELMNTPAYIKYIGDRNIHSIEDAETFLENRCYPQFKEHGFGMFTVDLVETGKSIGICGLVIRPELPYPDLGFAFLPEYEGKGYAREGADYLIAQYGPKYPEFYAITTHDNERSKALLGRLGFHLADDDFSMPNDPERLFLFKRVNVGNSKQDLT